MRIIEHTIASLNARADAGEYDGVIGAAYNAGFSVVQLPNGKVKVYATFLEAKATGFKLL